uniref:Uncharacterized protein n=1 Tax=Arundo donax TaxID=35708 RepID=A0A0A8Y6I7_ARUDO
MMDSKNHEKKRNLI